MDACSSFHPSFDIGNPNWDSESAFGIVNQTVGYVLCANKDWYILAAELDQDGRPRDIMNIPTNWVLEVLELQAPTVEGLE